MSKVKSLTSKVLIALLLAVLNAQAIEFVQRDQFISSDAETLRDEMWISAQTITISGEAQDDLFAMGNTLSLQGQFNGDVWAAGDQVIAAGNFNDHVRLAGRTTQVSGKLSDSLTAIGNAFVNTTIKIDSAALIEKNVFCSGGNVISEGSIAGDMRVIAQKATLGGTISGNVSVTAQEIVILPGTVIGGNINYTAPKELVLLPTVKLAGNLIRTFAPPIPATKPLGNHFGFALAALIAGLFFSAIFPVYTGGAVQLLKISRAPCMLIGLAALFLIPVGAILLLFTFVGIPLSLLLFFFYAILLYLSKIVVGLTLGALILRRKEITKRNRVSTLAAGLLIIYALTAFTAISLFVNILVAVAGLGALLLALLKKPVLIIQTPADIKTTMEG